jgi:hypothetical protein
MADSAEAEPSVALALSDTPLSNAFRMYLERAAQRPLVNIPWEAFRRERYAEAALRLATSQAVRLAEGEYNSVGLFGQIASGLALNGAPFDVITEATTIAHDEIRHATYCLRLAQLCSGTELRLPVHRREVAELASGLLNVMDLDFFILKYSAVGETLAAALLDTCTRQATDPVAAAVYGALASDEVHHARLGWYYLSWRAPQWSLAERQSLSDRLGRMVMGLEKLFWTGRDAPTEATADAHALGVLDSETQRGVIDAIVTAEIVPGLDALGLGASHAWQARTRQDASSSQQVGRSARR